MRNLRSAMLLLVFGMQVSPANASDEVTASVTLADRQVQAEGKLIAPTRPKIRSVIVVMAWGIGRQIYEDPRWRELASRVDAGLLLFSLSSIAPTAQRGLPAKQQVIRNSSLGGGEALIALIDQLSQRPGYSQLRSAPLLLWGFSASGSFAMTFAAAHQSRTIGFIRYQSHLRTLPMDIDSVGSIPALILAGGADKTAGTEDAQQSWMRGRSANAPWTFGVQPRQGHGEGVAQATDFMIAWVEAVMMRRLGSGGSLQAISDRGWMGDLKTLAVSHAPEGPALQDASWLPDERTAKLWEALVRQGLR